MIGFTPQEFNQVREAIAGAHLYCQAVAPMLKARHTTMNRDQRNLAQLVPQAVAEAFTTIAAITHRENKDHDSEEPRPATKLTEVDVVTMRDELENVSALVLPDLVSHMGRVLEDLPMYNDTLIEAINRQQCAARLMAWTWEAGRRYGLQQAMAIIEGTTAEFCNGTITVLDSALNGTLDLPTPEAARPAGELVPFTPIAAATGEGGEARSTVQPSDAEIEAFQRALENGVID